MKKKYILDEDRYIDIGERAYQRSRPNDVGGYSVSEDCLRPEAIPDRRRKDRSGDEAMSRPWDHYRDPEHDLMARLENVYRSQQRCLRLTVVALIANLVALAAATSVALRTLAVG
ncbi:hypothetical protein [Allomesorhizobium camelthorni]|uniref:Uncharacterized protein n=1 Tax=Allomesorhizobium camelthorni TaxID=475069 RepID=A0A6G4WKB2_9HYPH|nr:hypothetical protein [Mesorhizobium camelthorni]NGO54550.1 hypothetical protein [Mesorhizobium camelthorni]